jgi:hypothetical protein
LIEMRIRGSTNTGGRERFCARTITYMPDVLAAAQARSERRLHVLYASAMSSDDELLPRDPDLDDVPPELAALDGGSVTITGRDPVKDRLNRGDGTIVVVPALFAHARRLRQDHVDDE